MIVCIIPFRLQVTTTDILPKFICTACLKKVNAFHEFYCDVHVGQQKFVQNWVKKESCSVDDAIDDSSTANVENGPSVCKSEPGGSPFAETNEDGLACMENYEYDYDEKKKIDVTTIGAKGKLQTKLLQSLQKHLPNTFICYICNKSFINYKRLDNHMQSHVKHKNTASVKSKKNSTRNREASAKPFRRIKCEECGKVCQGETSYSIHMAIHRIPDGETLHLNLINLNHIPWNC